MAEGRRSPFGDRILDLRQQRRWSQGDLADATAGGPREKRTAKRTIATYEARKDNPADWVVPHTAIIEDLAWAFSFPPQSDGHRDLVAAALETERLKTNPTATHGHPALPNLTLPLPTPMALPSATPFITIGREPHLKHIADTVQRAASGQPGMLFVQADPGAGKTTLIVEACRRALDQHPNLVVLWGNCSGRLGVADPYQPFRHVLRTMLADTRVAKPSHLINQRNVERILGRLPRAIRTLRRNGQPLRHRLIPASVFDTPAIRAITTEQTRLQVEALRSGAVDQLSREPNLALFNVLRDYAYKAPTILVIEDLHWTDPGTADVLTRYISHLQAQPSPILVIGSFRPADIQPSSGDMHHPVSILLREAAKAFADSIVDLGKALVPETGKAFIREACASLGITLSDEECDAIYQRTGGLPYVLENLVQVYGSDIGARSIAANASASLDGIPDDYANLVESRIENLTSLQRRAIKVASVQGNSFSAEILRVALGAVSHEEFAALLRTLEVDLRLIQQAGMVTIADLETREYEFGHALLRDSLYLHQMSDLERAHAHAITAEALVTVYGETPGDATAALAVHLDQAGDIAGAARAWIAAGNHAQQSGQFDRALQAFETVHAYGQDLGIPELETEALIGLGTAARSLDRTVEAAAWLERGVNMAIRRGFVSAQARAISTLGMLDYDAGNVARGRERLQEAITLHLQVNDLEEANRSISRLSYNLHGLGNYDDATIQAERSIALARETGNLAQLVGANVALANCWLDLGLYSDALALYEESLAISESIPDDHRINLCLLNIIQTHFDQQNWDLAEEVAHRLLQPGRSIVQSFVGVAEFQMGIIREGQQRIAEAAPHYQAAHDIRAHNGQGALLIDTLGGLLRVAIHHDARKDITHLSERIDQAVADHGLDGIEHAGRLCLTLIEAANVLGDGASARRHLAWGRDFINDRAARLSDPAHRHSYVTNVLAHHRILNLAAD